MEESWSWDGSLVSLHSSMAASTRSTRSTRREEGPHSIILPPPPAAVRADPAPHRASYRLHTPPAIQTRPPSPVSREAAPLESHSSSASPLGDASSASQHPLASILLSNLSPPVSPVPSTASFPRSGSRSRISSTAGSLPRPGRGRTRTRRGASMSSATSNDGSALGDEAEGEESESSSTEDPNQAQSALVMPSLTMQDGTNRDTVQPDSRSRTREFRVRGGEDSEAMRYSKGKINLLILGKTAEDRQTLSTLLSSDGQYEQHSPSASFDLLYSFATCSRFHEGPSSSGGSGTTLESLFVSDGACGPTVTLSYPPTDELVHEVLLRQLRQPLEKLEAKIARHFPSTQSLASLLADCGVGEFDASLFLFSSPPLPSEIAIARSVSHLLPILPVLILPPSPTSKPQKTLALSNAVIHQLDSAGVRWLPIETFDRRTSRSPTRRPNSRPVEIGGGPLSMLPHDLFVQSPPSSQRQYATRNRDLGSTPTTSFPSPTSEPTSLTSSQELPPLSPTFTTASSSYRSSSSRASSARSLSPSSSTGRNTANLHHLTLLDLHRLRRILHADDMTRKIRRARALTFLEWREVEVAARGYDMVPVDTLPEQWAEMMVESLEAGQGGRRGLDFSKRVAERRKALIRRSRDKPAREQAVSAKFASVDDGDVLDIEHESDQDGGRRLSLSASQDPTTPKPCFRQLPGSSLSSLLPLSTPTAASSNGTSGSSHSSSSSRQNEPSSAVRSPSPSYFPPYPPPPLSASIVSLPTTFRSSASSLDDALSASAADLPISLLRACEPFHLPSLLHLVGLNLRLALLQPCKFQESRTSCIEGSTAKDRSIHPSSRDSATVPAGSWWKTFAVLTAVFAAGVVAGARLVDTYEH